MAPLTPDGIRTAGTLVHSARPREEATPRRDSSSIERGGRRAAPHPRRSRLVPGIAWSRVAGGSDSGPPHLGQANTPSAGTGSRGSRRRMGRDSREAQRQRCAGSSCTFGGQALARIADLNLKETSAFCAGLAVAWPSPDI